MADEIKVHWDEAELSQNPRWGRISKGDRLLQSPYPPTMIDMDDSLTDTDDEMTDRDDEMTDVDDDLIDTDDEMTDVGDALVDTDGSLTDTDDEMTDVDDDLIDMDDTLTDTDDALTDTDNILIDKDGTSTDTEDDLTDTDDTLIDRDGSLADTNDALPNTDIDSLAMKYVLSIDGSGIIGYSSLVILQALMEEIEEIERAHNPKATSSNHSSAPGPLTDELCAVTKPVGMPIFEYRPFHYFDYIGGTGSGNVIAMMLHEGKMSVAEVMERYRDMCAPGGRRRLIGKKVVFSKRDKASRWFNDHAMKPVLALANLNKDEGATVARKPNPYYNNPSRAVLEDAHFRLVDDSSAKAGIYLLSIGGAITEPVDHGAYPLQYQMSKQIQRVHDELSLRTHPANRNPLFNLKRYSRLDVRDTDLGEIALNEWNSKDADEQIRKRIVRATNAYLREEETKDVIRKLATRLVNKRRFRAGRLHWERWALGVSYRYPELGCEG